MNSKICPDLYFVEHLLSLVATDCWPLAGFGDRILQMVTSGAADPCMASFHAGVNMYPNIDVDDQCGVTPLFGAMCAFVVEGCCRALFLAPRRRVRAVTAVQSQEDAT